MSDTEYLDRDAFVCPECGGRLPSFLLPETDDYGTSFDGAVVAWTEDGEPARIVVGLDWDAREREVSAEELEASREAYPDGYLYCGRGDHYFNEPAPAEDA